MTPSATSCWSCAANALTLSESSAARRCSVCSRRSLRLRAQEPPPHPGQRLDPIPGAHPGQGPLPMLRGRLLLSKPRTRGPWRWTTSCRGTRAARTRPQPPAGPLLPLQCRQARCSLPTQEGTTDFHGLQASDDLRGTDQKGKVAATSERRISRVSGSMGEGSKPMCR